MFIMNVSCIPLFVAAFTSYVVKAVDRQNVSVLAPVAFCLTSRVCSLVIGAGVVAKFILYV